MTTNIDSLKIKLIEEITAINSEEELANIIKLMRIARLNSHYDPSIFKPTRTSISVEVLKTEQNFKGIDREAFDRLVETLDIQEPIDELLEMLD